eukprot:symbB.v1.2.007065.t1/scaffold414.1/size398445/29
MILLQKKLADLAAAQGYLRAHGDSHGAAKALAHSLRWREETQPELAVCGACAEDPRSHNMRVVGIDRWERPVLYTCFSQANNRSNAAHNVNHLLRSMEDSCSVMRSRSARLCRTVEAEAWVFVIDFHGYSWLVDTNPRTALLAAQLLAHYPERLGRCLLVDAPAVFASTWSAVRGILNEVTAGKIVFVRSDDGSLTSELKQCMDPSLQKWLISEMAENRLECNQDGRKLYWKAPREHEGAHDPRGDGAFLASPEFHLTLTSRLASQDGRVATQEKHGAVEGCPWYPGVFLLLSVALLWVGAVQCAFGVPLLFAGWQVAVRREPKTPAKGGSVAQTEVEEPLQVKNRSNSVACLSCFSFCGQMCHGLQLPPSRIHILEQVLQRRHFVTDELQYISTRSSLASSTDTENIMDM